MEKSDLGLAGGSVNAPISVQSRGQDYSLELWGLVERFQSGEIKAPLHQRDNDAWPLRKQIEFINRCRKCLSGEEAPPLGTICLYALQGNDHTMWLNDGLQRISTAIQCKLNPSKFNLNDDVAKNILRKTRFLVQERIYVSHLPAVEDFCNVNKGTSLEPSEQFSYVLTYSDGWVIWEKILDDWAAAISAALAPFCTTDDFRKTKLTNRRLDLRLFAVAHIGRPSTISNKKPHVEELVVSCFKESSSEQVKKHIRTMQDFAADMHHAWLEHIKDPRKPLRQSLARWLLGVRFLHQRDTSPKWWEEFHARLFGRTDGAPLLSCHGKAASYSLTKRLDFLAAVCRELELEPPLKEKRKARDYPLRPGWEAHHSLPFADHGEGPTEPLPARLNAAKNART